MTAKASPVTSTQGVPLAFTLMESTITSAGWPEAIISCASFKIDGGNGLEMVVFGRCGGAWVGVHCNSAQALLFAASSSFASTTAIPSRDESSTACNKMLLLIGIALVVSAVLRYHGATKQGLAIFPFFGRSLYLSVTRAEKFPRGEPWAVRVNWR